MRKHKKGRKGGPGGGAGDEDGESGDDGGDGSDGLGGPEEGEICEVSDEASPTKGRPKLSPNFEEPTNPTQDPPPAEDLPPGHRIKEMPPTEQYPDGYWKQIDGGGNPVDPSTGKTPGNVTKWESRARTHVRLPPKK